MATRRIGESRLDHGAQFFTVRAPRFREVVERWEQAGWVAPWFSESGHTVEWIADNTQKSLSTGSAALTIHDRADFSRRYLEAPKEDVAKLLLEAAEPWFRGLAIASPEVQSAGRPRPKAGVSVLVPTRPPRNRRRRIRRIASGRRLSIRARRSGADRGYSHLMLFSAACLRSFSILRPESDSLHSGELVDEIRQDCLRCRSSGCNSAFNGRVHAVIATHLQMGRYTHLSPRPGDEGVGLRVRNLIYPEQPPAAGGAPKPPHKLIADWRF
jgi:hypothetical protein